MNIPQSDKGLVYTGPSIEKLDIKTGETYSEILPKIINASNKEEKKNEDSYSGKLYNLGKQQSDCAFEIKDTSYSYNVNNSGVGIEFTYDLSKVIKNLPQYFIKSYIEVNAIGTSNYGETALTKLDMEIGGFNIMLTKLPVTITIKITLSSPCGMIELTDRVTIFSTTKNGDYVDSLNINDNSPTKEYKKTKDDVIELLAAEVSILKQEISSLKSQVKTLKQ